ncbi:vegetative cell wall protein gp1-like [Oncorhynchus kisutch]|uniref:vegetative cell wall protein gp1-like n=1 Tax=Oncorhynchus kisutch TaxID=8019 RepID=UPI0012DDBE07|nr:vegetative cell wall protein gp1-like [Oncorhynchus kisutch]
MLASSTQQAHANSYGSQQRNSQPCSTLKDEKSPRHCSSGNMEDGDKLLAPPPSFGSHFERTIDVVRGNRSLGLTVSAMKDGSGMLIRSVVRGGSVCQDGRLGVGDTILAVNGEPTTNLTNAMCRAMLRRHSVIGSDMSVTFIPSFLVEEHRASMAQQPLSSIMVDGPSLCPLTPSPTPPGGPTSSPTPPGGLTPSLTPPGGLTPSPTPSWRSNPFPYPSWRSNPFSYPSWRSNPFPYPSWRSNPFAYPPWRSNPFPYPSWSPRYSLNSPSSRSSYSPKASRPFSTQTCSISYKYSSSLNANQRPTQTPTPRQEPNP